MSPAATLLLLVALLLGRLEGLGQDHGAYKAETSDEATAELLAHLPSAATVPDRCRAFPTAPDVSGAAACLALTTPGLRLPGALAYPPDAEAHFLEVERSLARWKQKPNGNHKPHRGPGYGGPWIENHWIAHFESLLYLGRPNHGGGVVAGTFGSTAARPVSGHDKQAGASPGALRGSNHTSWAPSSLCLRDVFGPYVPLLVPWVDRWLASGVGYPSELKAALANVLRKDVPYITVSQNDQGLYGLFDHAEWPNVLVLSAGGYGHGVVPLLKQEEAVDKTGRLPVAQRSYLASFEGNVKHGPGQVREKMARALATFEAAHAAETEASRKRNGGGGVGGDAGGLPGGGVLVASKVYAGGAWREVMASSRVSLNPRGFGRTSYHVSETVQMGLVPLHVFVDRPWVPYADTVFKEVGFVTDLQGLEVLLARLAGVPVNRSSAAASALTQAAAVARGVAAVEAREAAAEKYRASHFTYRGAMDQIHRFMIDPKGSDLRCTPLPADKLCDSKKVAACTG